MKTFYVGIKGVIVKDGKVLVLRANEERDSRWEMPGGRIEANETIEQALRRELQEELPNITDIKVGEVLGAHRLHKDMDGEKSLVLIYYRVEARFPGNPELSEEHLEYKWAGQDRIRELIKDASHQTILRALETL